ncbi:hypothetical protein LR68_03813 [Anoxybacillus sp. BCO1]|nr:hypothetical protein LR68_03813 [Anoxybacillus sp. BCO1]
MYSQLADEGASPEDALESLELQQMVQEAILKLTRKISHCHRLKIY